MNENKTRFKRENTTEVGFKYEKYIANYFVEQGYNLVVEDVHPSFKCVKPTDVLNLDGICIECKWQSRARIPQWLEQAKATAKELDEVNKENQKFNNIYTGSINVLLDTNLKKSEYKPLLPAVFYKRRDDREENPNPESEDYVAMRLEDWIELYKAYQEKEYPDKIKILNIEYL